jgi:SP family general alpha glucoside:H+ symporter-like MFS transporter
MSTNIIEKPDSSAKEFETHRHEISHDVEKTGYDKGGAIDAENIEHQMTVMQAVKAYPAASWWAFVMSSTIVSSLLDVSDSRADDTTRSWSRTAFS